MNRKPLLVFDGDCGFCRRWIWRWKIMTGDKVDYAPYQEAAGRFPDIPKDRFQEAVQLIEADDRHYAGAEAVFRTLAYVPGKAWPLRLYQRLPGFAPVAEWGYRLVANRRPAFSSLTSWLLGSSLEPPSYVFARWIFIRLIAAIFAVAFISLWVQIGGLLGSQGILPAKDYLEAVAGQIGLARYWLLPTLAWINSSDFMLHFLAAVGTAASLGAMIGVFPGPLLLVAWAFYLSLVNVGQEFLSFQWDALLLEAGFLSIFFAPWKKFDRPAGQSRPSRLFLWLLRWLMFRLMFESGCVKLLSGDRSWRNLTALAHHYETQCLPTWLGWYAHQLPMWFQKTSTALVFFMELAVPFLIFAPRRPRMLGCAAMIAFQFLIFATGNYCFFNLLTIALCLLLIDDAAWRKLLPERWISAFKATELTQLSTRAKRAVAALAIFLIAASGIGLAAMFRVPLGPAALTLEIEAPFRLVNNYGLFAIMTTVRNEIIIEGSRDGKEWKEYEFKWKPGDVHRRPAFTAPHQPRLDWQMWFAALGTERQNPWVLGLMIRLLQGSRPALALLGKNPFPDSPPQYIRALLYEYHFTDFAQRRADGSWWKRELKGNYTREFRARQ